MTLSIDFNSIKGSIISAYQVAAEKVTLWMGHAVVMIKSSSEKMLPYLQDKRIAAVSLIALTLILIELGDLFSKVVAKILPDSTDGQKAFSEIAKITIGLSTIACGVAAFTKYGKLPLHWMTIIAVSALTTFMRAPLTKEVEPKTV